MARIKDEVGNVYGRLRVLSFAFTKPARSLRAKPIGFADASAGLSWLSAAQSFAWDSDHVDAEATKTGGPTVASTATDA